MPLAAERGPGPVMTLLRVRTNVVIIASALGYFYFAGLRSFAVIFATATTALASRRLRRGYIHARVVVPAVCLLALAPVLAPAIATQCGHAEAAGIVRLL